jgi:antitoxin MazE
MYVVIKKWGNGAAVRLPDAVMKSAGLTIKQTVEVEARDAIITLPPLMRRRRTLEELISATPSFERGGAHRLRQY